MDKMQILNILVAVALFGFFYLIVIRPQQKREKAVKEMRSSLKIGDDVITIGGISGRITKITEEQVTIEVGADKVRFNMEKWGIAKKVDK